MAISLNINGKSHNVNSDPDLATIPSNPDPASTRREPRSLNRETLFPDHGPGLLSRLLSKIGRWLIGAVQLRY